MARRFELGMTLDYVGSWSIEKAINEIFQNALDEEIQNKDNKWYFDYDKDSEVLKIGNKFSSLKMKSLLLGCSSKRGDDDTIGQHGEGYKVATIVLLRNGLGVKVYNYIEKEIWTAKVVNSRRYDMPIAVFDVEKVGMFSSVPDQSLIFEISGVSEEVYENLINNNLWVEEDIGEVLETEYGRVLLDDKYKGRVFVKGLYVCDKESLSYGYDLAPSLIKLDRDRGLIDSFDLQYSLGKLLVHVSDIDFINQVRKTWDGKYLRCFTYYANDKLSTVYDTAYKEFVDEHGDDAYPCTTTTEFNSLSRQGLKAVLVTEEDAHFIKSSSSYSSGASVKVKSLETEFREWYENIKEYLPENVIEESEELIEAVLKNL